MNTDLETNSRTFLETSILNEFDYPVFLFDYQSEEMVYENSFFKEKVKNRINKRKIGLLVWQYWEGGSTQIHDISKDDLNKTEYRILKIKKLASSPNDVLICFLSDPILAMDSSLLETMKEAEIGLKFGTWLFDIEKNKIIWSKGMFEIFGLDPKCKDCVKLETYLSHVHPDDLEIIKAQNEFFIKNGYQKDNYQHRIITPTGEVKLLVARAKVLSKGASKVTKMMGYVSDVTSLKETESSLSRTIIELEKTNFLLKNFASFASHDLQEPLRKIQVFADRFAKSAEGILDEKSSNYWSKMRNSISRLHVLMQGILNLSSLSKNEVSTETVDLNSVIARVVEDFELKINDTSAEVNYRLSEMQMDPVQAYQLFQNLINNALKFNRTEIPVEIVIEESKPSITELDLLGLDIMRNYRKISLSDNGIGFDESQAKTMFSPFTRFHNKKDYEGNGIGLAICERIVLNHDGLIVAKSRKPFGATFEIFLPLNANHATKP